MTHLKSEFDNSQFLQNIQSLNPLTSNNPTNMAETYWQSIIQNERTASDTLSSIHTTRTGQSRTLLADGREIFIGGELENNKKSYYYNDVIVKYPDNSIKVFTYLTNIFPPLSFHTATLVANEIWIIGFAETIQQDTPVYRLNIHNFNIQRVEIRNNIGIISKHTTMLKNNQLIVTAGNFWSDTAMIWWENIDTWALNLKTFIWKNITKRQWQCFSVQRKDHHFLQYQQLATNLSEQIFNPPIRHEIVPHILHHRYCDKMILIDDIEIRYVIQPDNIQVYIEGILSEDILELLQENLRHKLSKIESFPCEIKLLNH